MLLESARGSKGFSALDASVRSSSTVLRPNVSLKIRRIGEDLSAAGREKTNEISLDENRKTHLFRIRKRAKGSALHCQRNFSDSSASVSEG